MLPAARASLELVTCGSGRRVLSSTGISSVDEIYSLGMKHLVDLNEDALDQAARHLGTPSIKATVNAALQLAAGRSPADQDLDAALAALATVHFEDRSAAWR